MKTVRKYRQDSGKEKTADRKYAEYHYECLSPIQKKYYKEIHKSLLILMKWDVFRLILEFVKKKVKKEMYCYKNSKDFGDRFKFCVNVKN